MNTRLQVEHGITELVTGLDLVELQLRVAAGEPLPVKQEQVYAQGHAIEVRVYPEDPETFMPSVGVVSELEEPEGEHIRVDSALFPGYEVTPYYEPLLSKPMAWGEGRDEAVERLYNWLRRYRIGGVNNNIALLRKVLTHPDFMSGDYDTTLLQRSFPAKPVTLRAEAAPANGQSDERELAAIIGAAIALGADASGPPPASNSPWKQAGLREQMLPRRAGGRSWR
jgi:acetyl/propionyl-CoA carboxylase alpha subunit